MSMTQTRATQRTEHTIRFRSHAEHSANQWRCSCGTKGHGEHSAERHAFENAGSIQMGGQR